MKILVTGGAGFIGSHVSEILLARGDCVVVVDEMNSYYDPKHKKANLAILRATAKTADHFRFYEEDVADLAAMDKIFEAEQPEMVCHLAARAGVRPSLKEPHLYIHSNIVGTVTLLELSAKYMIKNFVYASSSSVYGLGSTHPFSSSSESINHLSVSNKDGLSPTISSVPVPQSRTFTETDITDTPISHYAATKKSCELMAFSYHHLYGLKCTGLRFFTVYGPRGRIDMAPLKFTNSIMQGLPIPLYGDGTSSRDYTFISDITQGVISSLDNPHDFEVFNLGNSNTVTLREFIDTLESLTGKKAVVEWKPEQPGDVKHTHADIGKAKAMLGYDPQVKFRDGMKMLVEWYQKNASSFVLPEIQLIQNWEVVEPQSGMRPKDSRLDASLNGFVSPDQDASGRFRPLIARN